MVVVAGGVSVGCSGDDGGGDGVWAENDRYV